MPFLDCGLAEELQDEEDGERKPVTHGVKELRGSFVHHAVTELLDSLDALEAWALTFGAVEIEGYCRPAMARLTRRLGWKFKLMIVSRDLRRRLQ